MSVYFSEINIWGAVAGGDFFEVAAPKGTDLSGYEVYIYQTDGTIKSGPWSLDTAVTTVAGQDVYVIDQPNDGLDLSYADSLALVDDDGNVVQYLATSGTTTTATEGPANGITATALGHSASGEVFQSSDGGSTYTKSATHSKGMIPCFATGTLIETVQGLRPVEKLRTGDIVPTFDGAPRPIKWIHSTPQDCSHGPKPILIKAGALGPGRPTRDLIISAQHRILVGVPGQLHWVFPHAALVPAKALVDLPGIRQMRGRKTIRWHHFALEPHGVVLSNGCATEALLVGKMLLNGLHHFEKAVLRQSFSPETWRQSFWNGEPAYPCLTVGEARKIVNCARRKAA